MKAKELAELNDAELEQQLRTFKEELIALLNKYKIEFDERYLWA